MATHMTDMPQFTTDGEDSGSGNGGIATLSGPLLVATIGALDREMRDYTGTITRVDIAKVTAIDTVGAWVVVRLARDHGAEITGASHQAQRLIDAVGQAGDEEPLRPIRVPVQVRVPEAVGKLVVTSGQGSISSVAFLGELIIAVWHTICHPRRLRITALIRQTELVGVNSLGIIGLMSFLIGVVIAQQGAVQLQQFGAEIYTINLTGRLALRELGVLMTAIMVAGRSGSAFAAQIGTMKLTEEIDAMRTIGVSPIEALVLPRVIVGVLMMPLLGTYAAVVAIMGGAVLASLTLDIPFFTFLRRIQEVVPMTDLWVMLIKAPVFGLIIAFCGCFQGMQVENDSEQVGRRTTQAVVQGIFMVIVLDAFFAVFFSKINWI